MLNRTFVDTDTTWLSSFRQDAEVSYSDTEVCILLETLSQTSSQSIISQHNFDLAVTLDELVALDFLSASRCLNSRGNSIHWKTETQLLLYCWKLLQ